MHGKLSEHNDALTGHDASRATVSVVIPTLNEEENIGWVLRRLPQDIDEVIVVDGDSTDRTVQIATELRPDVVAISQLGRGKGAALITGLHQAKGDVVVIIDADGSMDPAEIPALVGTLLAGADVAKGSRGTAGGGSVDLTSLRKLGNWGLTQAANLLYGQHWRELCYGYAAFWTDTLPLLGLPALVDTISANHDQDTGGTTSFRYGSGFEIEALLFCRAARAGLRVAEVFSFEHRRRYGESNLVTWRDGRRVATAIMRERRFHGIGALARHSRAYPILPALHELDPS